MIKNEDMSSGGEDQEISHQTKVEEGLQLTTSENGKLWKKE